MLLAELDYVLPAERIAHEPSARREDAHLLVLPGTGSAFVHGRVADLPALLDPGDLVVLNDTRVLPARLFARRRSTGGKVEVLLLEPLEGGAWAAWLRSGGRPQPGEDLVLPPTALRLRLGERLGDGRWRVEGRGTSCEEIMAQVGMMPLPPYIGRDEGDARAPLDRERYQTVFARHPGAIAAPTAGLHFDTSLLDAFAARGVATAFVTLHVGPGTFAPVRAERLEDHAMHEEAFTVSQATAAAWQEARTRGRRVVAIGTTTVRALESASTPEQGVVACSGRTSLLIQPGYGFSAIDALFTNFHLPRSTLLALVMAFAGRERTLAAYHEAIAAGYRFYSYGDAMVVL